MADTEQPATLLSLLRELDLRLRDGMELFARTALGAQQARVDSGTARNAIVSRATALWAVTSRRHDAREALERAGLSVETYASDLGLAEPAPLAEEDDAPIRPTLAAALRSYAGEESAATSMGEPEIALAILLSARAQPDSGRVGQRIRSAGGNLDEAVRQMERLVLRDGIADGEAPPGLSGSVRAVRTRLGATAQVTASQIASALQVDHPEYGRGVLGGVTLRPGAGITLTVDQWLTRILDRYDPAEVAVTKHQVVDGRLTLLALAVLDEELGADLRRSGVLEALGSEVEVRPEPMRRLPKLSLLADQPLDDAKNDVLDFGPYADAIADLIDNPETDTPLTIAISAPWGAGKTSLANLVKARLSSLADTRKDPPHLICEFNAWQHDDAAHLGSAFAADVAKQANRHRAPWRRVLRPLPRAMLSPAQRFRRQRALVAVALTVVVFSVAFIAAFVDLGQIDVVSDDLDELSIGIAGLGGTVALTGLMNGAGSALSAAKSAGRFVADPESASSTGSMDEVSQQLGSLISQALSVRAETLGNRRLVIFVDDLERCTPPRAIEVCEVASQLLRHPGVVTVLLADMAAVGASAEMKYSRLARRYRARSGVPGETTSGWGSYGRLFLQKIVQFQFDLPTPRPGHTADLVTQLLDRQTESDATPLAPARPSIRSHMAGFLNEHGLPMAVGASLTTLALASAIFRIMGVPVLADFVVVLIIALAWTIAMLRSARTARARSRTAKKDAEQVDSTLAALIDDHRSNPELLERLAQQQLADVPADLIRQRTHRLVADESEMSLLAQNVILRFLPPLPRSAKRMLNRLRFLMVIAIGRNLFDREFTGDHLGKWVVLVERWPELSWAIAATPSLLGDLEQLAHAQDADDQFPINLELATPSLSIGSPDIRAFLADEPQLGPVADRLVYFAKSATSSLSPVE